jgi:endonuclease/exonuclease/phosphatase family metal-dependent hydrolase
LRNFQNHAAFLESAAFFLVMKHRVASLLLVVLCLSPAMVACRKERASGPPKAVAVAEDGVLRLRVLTFNVRYENGSDSGTRAWRKRIVGVVRMIREESPDVFGVQEARHGQVADLRASLPDYEFLGVARDDGAKAGEYTGLFYLRTRFEAASSEGGVFWLSDTPHKPGSATWGNAIPRMAIWQRFTDRASQRPFSLYNTHWDHQHQGSRMKSAALLRHHITSRAHPEEPVVVLGDFNAIESNPGLLLLKGTPEGGPPALIDTFQAMHPAEKRRTTLHFWRGRRDGYLKVDHIFASQPVQVLSSRIRDEDQPMVSDHFPVVAEIGFPTR